MSAARGAAFEVLRRVETTSAHSDDLLHGEALQGLSQADRNLTTALVLGVLRWQVALDAQLRGLLDRPDQPLPGEILLALRLGAFQLLHMDRIPAHAALSESVELVRAAGHPKAAGLVNAVLRKLTAQPRSGKPIFESVDAFATRLGHPAWMVERWTARYGRAAALAVCEFDQREPARASLFAQESDAESGASRIDDGSRLVGELVAASHSAPRRIWDACAAPGGKTEILAGRHAAAEVLATDVSPRRLQAMRLRMERELSGRAIRMLQADATKLAEAEGSFDLILCDVPCSGTGTLARNPEIRHRLQVEELRRQAQRQRTILGAALARLNVGGRLVYSTCSLEPEENEDVVSAVMESSELDLRLVPASGLLERVQSLLDAGVVAASDERMRTLVRGEFLRTLPGANFPGDGFFAAVFERG
ncbi:MAG TPA: transcription antitermination factor NusB [Acidobacteriaceae bacterium]